MASLFPNAAIIGRLPATAATRPDARPKATGFHVTWDEVSDWASNAGSLTDPPFAPEGAVCESHMVRWPHEAHCSLDNQAGERRHAVCTNHDPASNCGSHSVAATADTTSQVTPISMFMTVRADRKMKTYKTRNKMRLCFFKWHH